MSEQVINPDRSLLQVLTDIKVKRIELVKAKGDIAKLTAQYDIEQLLKEKATLEANMQLSGAVTRIM